MKNTSKVSGKASCRDKRRGAFLLCIVDPLQGPNGPYSFHRDSSHLLLRVFQEKGYRVFLSDPTQLFLVRLAPAKPDASAQTQGANPDSPPEPPIGITSLHLGGEKLQSKNLTNAGSFVTAWETTVLDQEPYFQHQALHQMALDQFGLILMRKDPPVDQCYLTATHILGTISHQVPVINDPRSLQRWNEKLIIFNFPKHIPPTFVSAHKEALNHFIHSVNGDCILKPLDGFAGRGIHKVKPNDKNYTQILMKMTHEEKVPVVAQKFLKEIFEGEKRVFMIDGKPMGSLLKKPPRGHFIANPDLGATLARTHLTPKEKKLCQEVGSWLKKQKIFFAGLDLIGEKLTEINITSPGLIWEWDQVDNKRYEEKIVSLIERKFL